MATTTQFACAYKRFNSIRMKIFRTIFLSVSVLVGCNKITALRTPATSILSSNEARVKSSSLSKSTTTALEIGRGGDLPPLNQKSVATVGLAYLGLHGIVDIICPSKVVEFYGLDEQPALNPFYFSQIGALALNGVTFLLLQLYAKTSLINAVGYSCLPLSLLTVYQLAAGKYEKVSVFSVGRSKLKILLLALQHPDALALISFHSFVVKSGRLA